MAALPIVSPGNPGLAPGEKPAKLDDDEIVSVLEGYRQEATLNRASGLNPRDEKWSENADLYWNRWDFSKKATWQAKEVMPEVPAFVDRFAGALKEAMISTPKGFYTVEDDTDAEGDLAQAIKRMTDVWLARCGRNQIGQVIGFPAVFEEQIKLGAIAACASVVTWKDDVENGRVSIETVDPRFVWLDHTNRNLYRIRRSEIDKHELVALAKEMDSKGKPLFNLPAIEELVSIIVQEDTARRAELAGTGQQIITNRAPIVLDEYLATVIAPDGTVAADRSLLVVANERHLIRGPEANPFWHGKDWLLYTPLITTPLSPYGRSYMEDFGSIAKTFTELTNMILDAVFVSSLKAFVIVPDMLQDPEQARGGVAPNKTFLLEDGLRAQDFFATLDLGTLPAESVRIWQTLKNELTEAARMNEIGIGQFAPHARTSATEVVETQQSSVASIRSIASTVEMFMLDPMLDLVWKTGLQHANPKDEMLAAAAGKEMYAALIARRKELVKRPVTFAARGISALIQKARTLRALMSILQTVASNEVLLQEFLQQIDLGKLIELLFELSDVDLRKLQTTEREKMIRGVAERLQPKPGASGAPDGAKAEVAGVAKAIGGLGGAR